MKKTKYLIIISFLIVAFNACNPNYENVCKISENESNRVEDHSYVTAKRKIRPTILGQKKENPYSLENMKTALDTLLSYKKVLKSTYADSSDLSGITLSPTDLYVRFLPQDSTQYNQLMRDTGLTLFDFPLDYEIIQVGDYYQSANSTLKWYYTTVKPDYKFNANLKYEILDTLFIIEHSPDYSEEDIDTNSVSTKRISQKTITPAIANALYAISFTLTGNQKELNPDLVSENNLKQTIVKCKKSVLAEVGGVLAGQVAILTTIPKGIFTLIPPLEDDL